MSMPPKPSSREGRIQLWHYVRHIRHFGKDILASQPARLYHAWMAEFRTPFFSSYLCNQPDLVSLVLKERPDDFPKSSRVREGLAPLLGNSVFLTNGPLWKRQRRIIDPSFEGGKLRDTFPAMLAAAQSSVERFKVKLEREHIEIEEETSHLAADVIFRTLFSIPIEHKLAKAVFEAFQGHQRAQPMINLGAFFPLPHWVPRFHRRKTRQTAASIRGLITQLIDRRMGEIRSETAPNDLATKIMTTADPLTGNRFDTEEMVDQVAIFFLAGHETTASSIAWALYLLAMFPEWQEKLAQEASAVYGKTPPKFSDIAKLQLTRDVVRETLRLYPPVPMMVREAACPERFRDRPVPKGSQIVLSPWHLHRHERLWENPDGFDPSRFQSENGKACLRDAYIPFSAGQRVCPGAGFAMIESVLVISLLVQSYKFEVVADRPAIPQAHLTVRSKDGIWLKVSKRP